MVGIDINKNRNNSGKKSLLNALVKKLLKAMHTKYIGANPMDKRKVLKIKNFDEIHKNKFMLSSISMYPIDIA